MIKAFLQHLKLKIKPE